MTRSFLSKKINIPFKFKKEVLQGTSFACILVHICETATPKEMPITSGDVPNLLKTSVPIYSPPLSLKDSIYLYHFHPFVLLTIS